MKIVNLKEKCFVIGVVLAVAAGMYLLHIPCPFQAAFHIPCPGCGITRAWLSLFRGDLSGAFALNPLFWVVPVGGWLYLCDHKPFRKGWLNVTIVVAVYGSLLANWVITLVR